MQVAILSTQFVLLTAGYTADGAPPANDNFSWTIDDSGAATLSDNAGGAVKLIAQKAGKGTVTLNDSAGLLAATLDYEVTESIATGLTITVGDPQPKDAPVASNAAMRQAAAAA